VVTRGPLGEALTEVNLSETFGLRLQLEHTDGRWTARRKTSRASRPG
jgi:iron complex transport system ATP-binding protein